MRKAAILDYGLGLRPCYKINLCYDLFIKILTNIFKIIID